MLRLDRPRFTSILAFVRSSRCVRAKRAPAKAGQQSAAPIGTSAARGVHKLYNPTDFKAWYYVPPAYEAGTASGKIPCGDFGRAQAQREGGLTQPWLHRLLGVLVGLLCLDGLIASQVLADTYVIAIGNNRGYSQEAVLEYAEKDARRFRDVMQRYGNVDRQHSRLLLGKGKQALQQSLNTLKNQLKQRAQGAGHILTVYYSGHADARGLHLGRDTLPFARFKQWVEAIPAQVRVLIVDSCRSGDMTRIKGAKAAAPFVIRLEDQLDVHGMAIMTSSASSENSQESTKLRGSFFSHHLINGMLGAADHNRDKRVSLSEAYHYAYRETVRSTGRTLNLQHPNYAYQLKGQGELYLTYLARKKGNIATLVFDRLGQYTILTSSRRVLAELTVTETNTHFLVPTGRYSVHERAGKHYLDYDVQLAKNETFMLSSVAPTRRQYSREVSKGIEERRWEGEDAPRLSHRVSLGAAFHGAALADFEPTYGLNIDYGIMWQGWLSHVGGRYGRGNSRGSIAATAAINTGSHVDEWGIGLGTGYLFDIASTINLGLDTFFEAVYYNQGFDVDAIASRGSWGFSWRSTAIAEVALSNHLLLRVESGPILQVTRRATQLDDTGITQTNNALRVSWFVGFGMIARIH